MSFLLSLIGFFQIFSTRVDWINDFIDIPLKESATNYSTLPEARLFINGELVFDPEVYYERDRVEWTFMSTVNTSIVRAYHIKQRVFFPTYNITHVHTITFNIVDQIPPEFLYVPRLKITVSDKMPNFKEGVLISDNYDPPTALNLTVSTQQVLVGKVGIYPVYYQLSDVSGNVTLYESVVEIYDHLPPTITPKKALQIAFGETWAWQNFFDIKDNYDLFPEVFVNHSLVNYDRIGSYPVVISAKDSSGHETTFHTTLTILDLKSPEIRFKTITPINVFFDVTDAWMKSLILSVSDNYDVLTIDDVICTHDIESSYLGEYFIYYEVSDQSGNKLSTKLKIRVADLEKPIIRQTEPLIFDVFSPEPILISYFEFEDNYTASHDLIFKFVGTYKMQTLGKYLIRVEVTDAAKNIAIYQTYLEVVDRIPPELTQHNDIIITDFSKKNLSYYFSMKDNYDALSHLTLTIDDSKVFYDKIGAYPLLIYAIDRSDNLSMLETEVLILDIEEPKLILKQTIITVEVMSMPLNLITFIHSLTDNYDHLKVEDVVILGSIDYQTLGRYEIIYQIKDSSQNETCAKLKVIVDDTKPPTLKISSLEMKLNAFFNPLEGIEAFDESGFVTVTYFPKTIDTTTPGKKSVTYIAMDARGNYTTKERIIHITSPEQTYSPDQFLPIVVVTILGGAAIFYFYKRM